VLFILDYACTLKFMTIQILEAKNENPSAQTTHSIKLLKRSSRDKNNNIQNLSYDDTNT